MAYPQIPVALICSKTSPTPARNIGASDILIVWLAVTFNEGFSTRLQSISLDSKPVISGQHDAVAVVEVLRDSSPKLGSLQTSSDGAIIPVLTTTFCSESRETEAKLVAE